jgi:hypothetical protein
MRQGLALLTRSLEAKGGLTSAIRSPNPLRAASGRPYQPAAEVTPRRATVKAQGSIVRLGSKAVLGTKPASGPSERPPRGLQKAHMSPAR